MMLVLYRREQNEICDDHVLIMKSKQMFCKMDFMWNGGFV